MIVEYSTFGKHIAADAWGISFGLLNDSQQLKQYLVEAAEKSGATILSTQCQQFDPQGVSVLIMLSESHISIHTYPEKGFAALDCYTCGHTVDPEVALQYMLDQLKPTRTFSKILHRGMGTIQVVDEENEDGLYKLYEKQHL